MNFNKNNYLVLALVVIIAVAFYFLGKKNGEGQTKTSIIENVALVKEIAQLASLEVNGVTNIKISNRGDNEGVWSKFKNYFAENTLYISLPFEAKYGVDLKNKKMDIDTEKGIVKVYLPECKLLSLQLRLDKLESMSQAGLFNSVTINDFIKAQKQIYASASASLGNNKGYLKLAEDNISHTLNKYYEPLGYKVVCVFGKSSGSLK